MPLLEEAGKTVEFRFVHTYANTLERGLHISFIRRVFRYRCLERTTWKGGKGGGGARCKARCNLSDVVGGAHFLIEHSQTKRPAHPRLFVVNIPLFVLQLLLVPNTCLPKRGKKRKKAASKKVNTHLAGEPGLRRVARVFRVVDRPRRRHRDRLLICPQLPDGPQRGSRDSSS